MLLFLFVLTFVSYVVATPTVQSIELRIVGGNEMDITEAPYQVILQIDGDRLLLCGGVIIAENIILTAAHCVRGYRPEMYLVRAGSSYANTGGQLYTVGDLLWHPDYDIYTLDNDVAILWLSIPLTFSDSVAPIQMMSTNEEIPDGELTMVTGYGRLSEGGNLSLTLQGVAVPKINDELCYNAYQPKDLVTRNMLCAGYMEGGGNSCKGDSGGPLVYNNKLAGIVSWSVGCARPGSPGVFAKVSVLRPWIDNSIAYLRQKHGYQDIIG